MYTSPPQRTRGTKRKSPVLDDLRVLYVLRGGELEKQLIGQAARSRGTGCAYVAAIGVVAEEADESVYWLDVVAGAKLTTSRELPRLQHESRELTAIFSRAVGTARLNAKSR